MSRCLSLGLLLASAAALGLSYGEPAPKVVTTVKYKVGDLVGHAMVWPQVGKTDVKLDTVGDIMRFLVQEVDPRGWRSDQFSIVEVHGSVLEIKASKAKHEEIVSFLAALRRFAEDGVVVEAGVYAVDRVYYTKEFAPRFAKSGSRLLPLSQKEAAGLQRASRVQMPSKMRLSDGGRGQVFSLRQTLAFERQRALGESPTRDAVFVGIRLEAVVRVSGSYQYVRLRLAQHCTESVGTRKEVATNAKGEEIIFRVPDVVESSTAQTITVGDGVLLVARPAVELPGFDAKGPVPLLFVRPNVRIGEEEREKQRRKKEKKP